MAITQDAVGNVEVNPGLELTGIQKGLESSYPILFNTDSWVGGPRGCHAHEVVGLLRGCGLRAAPWRTCLRIRNCRCGPGGRRSTRYWGACI
jgi:hypothetical protein